VVAVAVIVAVGLTAWALWGDTGTGVEFVDFAEGSTATVGFAGRFPPVGTPALKRPLGMTGDGDRLYIALADAGAIGVFGYDGSFVETLAVPPADGAPVAYPVDVALLTDGRLAVVDTSGTRVITIRTDDPEAGFEPFATSPAVRQPTAVAASDGVVYIYDAPAGSVRTYAEDGRHLGDLGSDLRPPITFAGGIEVAEDTVWVSDSNAGRVVGLDRANGALRSMVQHRFDLPRGLTIALDGRIFITEAFGQTVGVFDAAGAARLDAVEEGSLEDLLGGGVALSPEDVVWCPRTLRLYVTDSAAGLIKVYNVREEAP
jgi:sugar lactone lactonase YvrE